MATKPFQGKDTKREEMAEAKTVRSGKITPKQYAAKEMAEGKHKGATSAAMQAKGRALASGKMSPKQYAAGYNYGGMVKKAKPC